jgi:glycosyltransferase involved in cell wall biosynthesis
MQTSRSTGEPPFGCPLRVLFINDTARNGGPGRSLYTILKFLDPRVIHRTVVLPRRGPVSDLLERARAADEVIVEPNLVENPIEPWSRAMSREDFDAPCGLRSLRLLGNVARAARGFGRLSKLAERGGYDLIYCNGTSADFAGGILSAATSVPALWHVRYTSIPRLVAPIHRLLSSSAGVRRIVCVSRAAAALFPHCREKIRVVHNAVDTDDFSPSKVVPRLRHELGIGTDAIVFGSHGRVLRRKGYVEFLRAAKQALARMTADEAARARFVVIGDTPEDFFPDHLAECRELARSSGIADKVHFLGFQADVRPYVADFDVAVVPSIYPDPLPRSVIESMAMGKPVIGFDVGGVSEMIDDGVTGTLVPSSPPDVGELAAQMLRYQRHPELRTRQGAAARAHVERSFDARGHARAIQDEIVGVVEEVPAC